MSLSFFSRLDSWVLFYCGALVALFAVALIRMVVQYRRVTGGIATAVAAVAGVGAAPDAERRGGRSSEAVERLRERSRKLDDGGASWWPAVDDAIERYESPESRVGYFVTRPMDELITLEDVTARYAWSQFHAVPGVLTSLGLLGTFLALLLGLTGLSMDASGTVTGLPGLVSNLSGKFLTSITALALSVIFLVIELVWCQAGLRAARDRLVHALARAVPLLSPSRIMLDIQRESVRTSKALRNIDSDLVDKFANVFRDDLSGVFAKHLSGSMATELQSELGPTLEALGGTMRELTATVGRLESQKQDSVVGELRGLTESLERSLRDSLADMGRQFQDALTGSTKDEFGALAEVVKGSAGMLDQMNQGFATMQATLQGVVEAARSNTSSQMQAGLEQTQRLNTLVEGLMTRLNESASQNYQQVTGVLTAVVTQLSDRVGALSDDLVKTVGAATVQSRQAASETMTQAGAWSAQTSKQLTDLLATLDRKSAEFDKAGQTLLAAQSTLQATLDQNHKALQAMGSAAHEVKTYSTSLAGLQRQVDEGQKTQTQLATVSRQSVEKLAEAARRHDEFLTQYRTTFEQYRTVFEGLDEQIARVLEAILDRLQSYNRSVEGNFKVIVDSANNVMPRMAGVIKQSTDELKEHLDELTDVLEKGTTKLAAATGVGRNGR